MVVQGRAKLLLLVVLNAEGPHCWGPFVFLAISGVLRGTHSGSRK